MKSQRIIQQLKDTPRSDAKRPKNKRTKNKVKVKVKEPKPLRPAGLGIANKHSGKRLEASMEEIVDSSKKGFNISQLKNKIKRASEEKRSKKPKKNTEPKNRLTLSTLIIGGSLYAFESAQKTYRRISNNVLRMVKAR